MGSGIKIKSCLTPGGFLRYDDVAEPGPNDSNNRVALLSSGKIPSAEGYEAPRVGTLVMWKSKPLSLFHSEKQNSVAHNQIYSLIINK